MVLRRCVLSKPLQFLSLQNLLRHSSDMLLLLDLRDAGTLMNTKTV